MKSRTKNREIEQEVNVGMLERLASLVGGGLLTAYAANRRPKYGSPLVVLATELFYRGITGHCPVYSVLGVRTSGQAKNYKQGIRASAEMAVRKLLTEPSEEWHLAEFKSSKEDNG